MELNLTTTPEIIFREPTPLVYLEKVGPFQKTAPGAWQEFWSHAGGVIEKDAMTAMMGLGRVDASQPSGDGNIYHAGVTLKKAPEQTPSGLQLRTLEGGKYARFLLTGSYMQLAAAYPASFAAVAKAGLKLRDDFFIEHYVNSPMDTAEENLKTEILLPIA